MTGSPSTFSRWVPFVIVSALFFATTASTFTSLGVALRDMIPELGWNYSNAGWGFTILALMVGATGQLPAGTIRWFGVKVTFALGGLIMAAGFALLATTDGLMTYFIGAGLAGLGYTLCSSVPAVYVINNWLPHRRSFAVGAYFTLGGLGGIAGPALVPAITAVFGSWRYHWWAMAISILALATIAVLFIKDRPGVSDDEEETPVEEERLAPGIFRTKVSWGFSEAIRTPQYAVIVAAMTMTLFCGVTMNTWAPTHMGNLGISAIFAAGALSAHQAVNSLARAAGGALATRIDPKWLLVAALAAEIVGMVALAFADDPVTIALFALGEGIGFGLCLFATAILLLNYFGPARNPELFGTMHLITTVAAAGPILGGFIGDTFGGFSGLFLVYAAAITVVLVFAVMMRPPHKNETSDATGQSASR